jgi:hypothetical protein
MGDNDSICPTEYLMEDAKEGSVNVAAHSLTKRMLLKLIRISQ